MTHPHSSSYAENPCLVQVHRIQNKKLWKAFLHSQACMKERWSHEPHLPLVNGGRLTLWHGTSHTEPYKIYGSELGQSLSLHCLAASGPLWLLMQSTIHCGNSQQIDGCRVL